MAGANQYRAGEFIDAIPGTAGIISTIAKKVGCSWHTAKKYIDTYPTINRVYQDEKEKLLDGAESVIISKIAEKDEQTAKWYLTMKGAERGYASKRRVEHSGKDGGPIETKDVSDLTEDERIARVVAILDTARERRNSATD